jgi:diguanylate cyclase (GGDEF)-like protein
VLVALATRIRGALREYDAVGRYGGEEFIAVLSNCRLEAAQVVCERIRRIVGDEPIATQAGPLEVTVSIGLVAFNAERADLEGIIGAADAALYRAKNNGRNRVEIEGAR